MSLNKNKLSLNFVLGTAAELIKVYPLIHLAQQQGHEIRVIATGQARENFLQQYKDFSLSENYLQWLIKSDGDLERASHAAKWFLRALFVSKKQLRQTFMLGEKAYVIVHGDTLSTLVGAGAGKRLRLPVVHVEAGLRSPHLLNPFPEEITRRLVSRLAILHMAPDNTAEANLNRIGIAGQVVNTQGNTLKDAVLLASENPGLVPSRPFALANLHRFENLNSPERWQTLVDVCLQAAKKIKLIFIMHPQTRFRLQQDAKAEAAFREAGIEIHERLSFGRFLTLLKRAEFLISDGGSNQEECSYLGKPCLLLRQATERTEGLNQSCVLSRFDPSVISEFLADWPKYAHPVGVAGASPSKLILQTLEKRAEMGADRC